MAAPMRMASTLLISGKVVMRQRKYTEVEMTEADATRRPIYAVVSYWQEIKTHSPTIQLSPRSLFTTHRVICPAAWMTSRLQKPSASWKTGVLYLSVLSQAPMETFCNRPSGPKIQSWIDVKSERLPPNVLSTQPALFV